MNSFTFYCYVPCARLIRNWIGPSFGMGAAEKQKFPYCFWKLKIETDGGGSIGQVIHQTDTVSHHRPLDSVLVKNTTQEAVITQFSPLFCYFPFLSTKYFPLLPQIACRYIIACRKLQFHSSSTYITFIIFCTSDYTK
jgi:hypothetical protein